MDGYEYDYECQECGSTLFEEAEYEPGWCECGLPEEACPGHEDEAGDR